MLLRAALRRLFTTIECILNHSEASAPKKSLDSAS